MRLSTRARYALRMMLDVARSGRGGEPVSLATVSDHTGISRGYLEQLALALRSAGLVRGYSGRGGGYRLTVPAIDMSLGQIVEAAIGPVYLVDCLEDPTLCPRSEYCECRVVYALINQRIQEVLRQYTLADLLEPDWVNMPASGMSGRLIKIDDTLGEMARSEPVNDTCPVCTQSKR